MIIEPKKRHNCENARTLFCFIIVSLVQEKVGYIVVFASCEMECEFVAVQS